MFTKINIKARVTFFGHQKCAKYKMASNNHFTEKKMTYDDINFSRCEAYSEFRDLCIKGVVSELDKFVQKHNYDVNTVDYDLCTLKVDKRLQRKSGLFCASLNGKNIFQLFSQSNTFFANFCFYENFYIVGLSIFCM